MSSFYATVTDSTRGTDSLRVIYTHFCSQEPLLLILEHQQKNTQKVNTVHEE
jgi:hypothetical protein